MTIKQLTQLAISLGLDDGGLDDVVHDAASRIGSDANNAGIEAQVRFLVAQYDEHEAEQAIREKADEEEE